jgi:hypothetical protein
MSEVLEAILKVLAIGVAVVGLSWLGREGGAGTAARC